MAAFDIQKLKKHSGVAICLAHTSENGHSPRYAIGLVSKYGTLASGDFLWHLHPNNVRSTLQRCPMNDGRFDFVPGSVHVILFKPGGKAAVTCTLATFRAAVNAYSLKGTRSLPVSVTGMLSAEWETYKESQRTAGLRSLVTQKVHPDDGKLISWLTSLAEHRVKLSPLPPEFSSIFSTLDTVAKPVNYQCVSVELVFAGEKLYFDEALEWKAKQLGVKSVSLRTWRLEGVADFEVERDDEEEEEEEETTHPKKRSRKMDQEDTDLLEGAALLQNVAQAELVPSTKTVPFSKAIPSTKAIPTTRAAITRSARSGAVPAPTETKYDAIARLAIELKLENSSVMDLQLELNAMRSVLASKTTQIEQMTLELEQAKAQAEQYKREKEMLQARVDADSPPLEQLILSQLSGLGMGEASSVKMFSSLSLDKRLEATMILDWCLGEERTLALLGEVMADAVQETCSKETVHAAVMRVLPNEHISNQLVTAWESKDDAVVKEALKTYAQPYTVTTRALEAFFSTLLSD